MMKRFEHSDYDMICKWWEAHKFPCIPLDFLPQYGAIAFDGDVPVACAWLYLTDSKLGWMEWFVSNPEYRNKEKRDEKLNQLIEHLFNAARDHGMKALFSSIRVPKLISRLESLGFTKSDVEMTNMIKVL